MNHYVIRLNVQPCEKQFMWRIWENGQELENARQVKIEVPSYTETTVELEPDRFGRYERNNIACDGYITYENGVAFIREKQKI
jgi:hypothetical protein